MMDRRTFISSVLGLIGAPYLAHAQAPRPAGKIGYLTLDPMSPSNSLVLLLRPAWQRLGYVEGETMLLPHDPSVAAIASCTIMG